MTNARKHRKIATTFCNTLLLRAQFCNVLTRFIGDERVWAVTFSSLLADLLMNKIPTPLSQLDLEIITIFKK